jgi:A/G-specific adenine glycosylase
LIAADIEPLLLPWYRAQHRDLPWRRTRDPYRIWVSEIMLQQTRVETVIPYYERWMQRFPTIADLARADLGDVLKSWEGLGYYARARNLQRAARVLVEEGRGVPGTVDELLHLPGIGRYTAGAIASLAFDRAAPALDGNVRRVLSRLYADAEPSVETLWQRAEELLSQAHPAEHNQAMMELGATVCTPRSPRCEACPLATVCQGRATGNPAAFSARKRAMQTPHHPMAMCAIHDGHGRLLLVRRPAKGLLGGLWELPCARLQPDEREPDGCARCAREEVGLEVEPVSPLASVDHAFTHFRITVHAWRCRPRAGEVRAPRWDGHEWCAPDDLPRYAFPLATRKVLAALHAYGEVRTS